ncbi:hypothetical protein [Paraburkholderia oxyphila]|uniref:hypothetical protein n=1 Tax=Paraburkholderia oxyphila TaxID=614212 RepID=UPI0012ED2C8F|nr:hypothetical protein [Paraburkholderia oxyphila]
MASLLPHHPASSPASMPIAPRLGMDRRRTTPRLVTVQMIVRVATRDAQLARSVLHAMLGHALGIHTIDIDRRRDLACLHVELERARVPEAMAVLIHTLPGAEFGTVRRLERSR